MQAKDNDKAGDDAKSSTPQIDEIAHSSPAIPLLTYILKKKKAVVDFFFRMKMQNERGLVHTGPTGSFIIAIPFISYEVFVRRTSHLAHEPNLGGWYQI